MWLCLLKIPTSWCCSVVDVDAEDHVDATKVCSRFWSWSLVKILNLNFGQDTTAGVWLGCWSKLLVKTLGLKFNQVFEDALYSRMYFGQNLRLKFGFFNNDCILWLQMLTPIQGINLDKPRRVFKIKLRDDKTKVWEMSVGRNTKWGKNLFSPSYGT